MDPRHDRTFTRADVTEILWRFGRRVALLGASEHFTQEIEPHYRRWAEEEIDRFLAEHQDR